MISLTELCQKLTNARSMDGTKKAIAVLWWTETQTPGKAMSIYALAKIMSEHCLGNPNREVLKRGLQASPLTMKKGSGFVLRSGASHQVEEWLRDVLDIAR